MHTVIRTTIIFTLAAAAFSQPQSLPEILQAELDRNFLQLKQKADPPPYYIGYEVTEQESDVLSGMLGFLQSRNHSQNRILDITVRVGSPKFDNYHPVRGERAHFTSGVTISLEDSPNALNRRLWLETDRAYRLAAQRLVQLRTNTQLKVAELNGADDFSAEEPSVHREAPAKVRFSPADSANQVRKWSAQFVKYPEVLRSSVALLVQRETKYLVNTDGTRLEHGRGFARVVVTAQTKAGDGMDLSAGQTFEAFDATHLPKDDIILASVDKVAKQLSGLVRAPVVEPFVGPAILSGRAAGVFFHEIFGHRVEGHRQKDESEGQTFTKSINSQVLPNFLSVIFDPTRKTQDGVDLNGFYLYDDEGVKARRVAVVENGVLKTFLQSRSPLEGFTHSNGHGRRQAGLEVVSRQSNLFVESAKQVPEKRLREMLVEEIRRQSKPYGLYFEQVTGGYTTTGRRGLQAFTVIPLVVFRVYADGRPDELVRGVDIVGTPLASFAKIIATSDKAEVFNGYCGAESGSVPVSAVSPALLVSEVEIQKKEASQDRPPLLPRPVIVGDK